MKKNNSLKKEYKLLEKVKAYEGYMEQLSDEELSGLTDIFKSRLQQGESLDDLLPEAFAAICEADKRVLGMKPYDVQILGGIALHEGCLAEMNTGEGKTLVATLPLYLNALTGKCCILLTTNDYLALRDAQEMGPVYEFMGLTIAAGVEKKPGVRLTIQEKQQIYQSDIVYSTHSNLGFDYLLNHLVRDASDRFLRELYYVILDEADAVLLDDAKTPLIISGSPRCMSNYYELADFFVRTLKEQKEYIVEDDRVYLTEEGIRYAEEFFQIENFYSRKYYEINRHVVLALRARLLMEPESDYVIGDDNSIMLLDKSTGRKLEGMKLRGGLHQALEEKEQVPVTEETRAVASITYQSLFRLFEKLAGMSGTISDNGRELKKVYHTRIVVIPPNRPLMRKDQPDQCFVHRQEQIREAMTLIEQTHESGQPILVIVPNIRDTEMISALLVEKRLPHSVLNANNTAWEASIIKEAGQRDAITVATPMAGRGTDIKLGEGVAQLGGLAVIAIGRMRDVRVERQVRGRAGRQGDPGFSRFFVSFEDDIVNEYGPDNLDKYRNGEKSITSNKIRKIVNHAQQVCADQAEYARKQSFDYDKVMQLQRDIIYEVRDRLLDGEELSLPVQPDMQQRRAILSVIDEAWVEQVDYLQQLMAAVSGRKFAQRNMVEEYQTEAYKAYLHMIEMIQTQIRTEIMQDIKQ